MARTKRDAKLDSRTARASLTARHAPYWTVFDRNTALGYRKGARGGMWIARFREDATGERQQVTLGPADDHVEAEGGPNLSYRQARSKALAWFARKADGDEAGDDGAYTVGKALDAYLGWFRQHKKAVRYTELTIEAQIRPALGSVELAKLTTAAIRDWHSRLAETPARLRTKIGGAQRYREAPADDDGRRGRRATANRILTVLKAALNHAFAEGKVSTDDAWRKVKPFRGADAARVRYLSRDECRRLLNACRPDFRRLVMAALVSGCRYGELTRLKAADFNNDVGSLLIRETKSGKPRHVPLDVEGRTFFLSVTTGRAPGDTMLVRDDGKVWGKAYQVRPLAEASAAARLEPAANFHCLRHTWASHRVMAGAPLMVVAQVLGHADTRMVEKHYGHLAPSFVREAIERTALGLGNEGDTNLVPLERAER
ncbi:MAG: tyrosine-type recombinase/integrase [Rhodospirillales bacterium]